MKSSIENKDLSRIRTLSELRETRERVNWEIDITEDKLVDEYYAVKGMFSISYLTGLLASRMNSLQSLLGTIYNGYVFARSLFVRKEERRESGRGSSDGRRED